MCFYNLTPTIYVVNKTNKDIENIYFTLDDYNIKDSKIKKIKSGETGLTSVYNRGYSGVRNLYLYYFDDNYKHQYLIYDKLEANYTGGIRVIINNLDEKGTFSLSVTIDYDHLKTH
jgi:hypothetical protein